MWRVNSHPRHVKSGDRSEATGGAAKRRCPPPIDSTPSNILNVKFTLRLIRECLGPVLLTRIWLRGLENLLAQDDRGPTGMQILRCAQDDMVVLDEV